MIMSNLIRSCSRATHPIDRTIPSSPSSKIVRLFSTGMLWFSNFIINARLRRQISIDSEHFTVVLSEFEFGNGCMMTEMEPQLSPDLIKIMDQRLSAIEHRNAILQRLINQVTNQLSFVRLKSPKLFFNYMLIEDSLSTHKKSFQELTRNFGS